tara:strand:+ start:4883 stop:5827 length:945 start_codon:yes stop_codon:yes gene_type:complete
MSKKLPPHPWDTNTAYYTAVHDVLNIELSLLEPEFVVWYKDMTTAERKSWKSDMVEYELQREADQVYKKALKMAKKYGPDWLAEMPNVDTPQQFAESQREFCLEVERFRHRAKYSYLIEEVEEVLSQPSWDHDKYVDTVCQRYLNEQIEETMDLFNLNEKEISRQSVLALRRLVQFINVRNRYERLSSLSAPAEITNNEAQLLIAHMEDLKRGCTNEELEAINDLYDIYLQRKETAYEKDVQKKRKRRKTSKKKYKDPFPSSPPTITSNKNRVLLEKHLPLIKETYETWTSAVNKKAEIYKNLVRAPGSAFSRK